MFNGYKYLHVINNTLRDNNDDQTVVPSNRSSNFHNNDSFYNEYGLLDLGMTDNFLTVESECLNIRQSKQQ